MLSRVWTAACIAVTLSLGQPCTEVDTNTLITYLFSDPETYPPDVTVCWVMRCHGLLTSLHFDIGFGDILSVGTQNFSRHDSLTNPVPFYEGDVIRFVSDSGSQRSGFQLNATCSEACKNLVGSTVIGYEHPSGGRSDGLDMCWNLRCDKAGTLVFDLFRLHIYFGSGDYLHLRSESEASYTGSSLPPVQYLNELLMVRFISHDYNTYRAFRANVTCFDTCTGGGNNGGLDVCKGCRCDEGEGDCDSDAECADGLVCSQDVGLKYGLPPDVDVCEKAGSNQVTPAPVGGACFLAGGDNSSKDFTIDYRYLESKAYPPMDVCWEMQCRGWITRLLFDVDHGDYLSIGSKDFSRSNPPATREPFFNGDVIRFVSESGSEGSGFQFNVQCSAPCQEVGNGSVIDYGPPDGFPSHLEDGCWNTRCEKSGVILFDFFALHTHDVLHFRTSTTEKIFTGDLQPEPQIFSGRSMLHFVLNEDRTSRGFRLIVKCFDACTGGGNNGDTGACRSCRCGEGEGNCDSDSECADGLICSQDVGLKYGLPPDVDVCEAPRTDVPSTSAPVPDSGKVCLSVDLHGSAEVVQHLNYRDDEDLCWELNCSGTGWVVFDMFSTDDEYDWLELAGMRYSGSFTPRKRYFHRLKMRFKSDMFMRRRSKKQSPRKTRGWKGFRATFYCRIASPALPTPPT